MCFFYQDCGCEGYIKELMPDKFSSRFDKCILMRYPMKTKDYYFYYKSKNKIFVAINHEIFLERNFLVRGSIESNV
jgi:hypothetical protein